MTELTTPADVTIETHTVGTGSSTITYDVRGDLDTASEITCDWREGDVW